MNRVYRVVVVDDDKDDLLILGASLQHPTVTAGRQLQIDLIEQPRVLVDQRFEPVPDIFILDYHFPLTSGLALVQYLRANSLYRASKILVWSARATEPAIAETLQAGADCYMAKPFTYQEILAKMKSILDMWCRA